MHLLELADFATQFKELTIRRETSEFGSWWPRNQAPLPPGGRFLASGAWSTEPGNGRYSPCGDEI